MRRYTVDGSNTSPSTTTIKSAYFHDYSTIIPISIACAMIAVIIACVILILILFTKRLHTVTHLLICDTCISSVLYCVVQSNNYAFLIFVWWETGDLSCRWRAYFSYMSIAAVMYSYLAQAISRLFFCVLSTKYRWLILFKTHLILIAVKWIIVSIVPFPALITQDISSNRFKLCWVPMKYSLHVAYTYLAYYFTPTILVVAIYIHIYRRVKRSENLSVISIRAITQNRDLQVLRNIMIQFGIFILSGIPALLHMITSIDSIYSIALVCLSLSVAIEKVVTIVINREIHSALRNVLRRSTTRITPIVFNTDLAPIGTDKVQARIMI